MKKLNYLRGGILGAVAAAIVAITAGAASADYPDKPITFIVPYSPGGGSDQQARRLQAGLQKELGVEIRIVYKTGGGGAIAFNELWGSKADGYTISNVVVPNIVITAKGKDVGFKPGEFSYVGMTARAVGALMVPKNSPYDTLAKFVAFAKANPGKLTVAGVGSTGGLGSCRAGLDVCARSCDSGCLLDEGAGLGSGAAGSSNSGSTGSTCCAGDTLETSTTTRMDTINVLIFIVQSPFYYWFHTT